MSPVPMATTFRNFNTPRYRFHILEMPTGVKFALLTKPNRADDMYERLQVFYREIYVPLVPGNIFEKPRTFAGNSACEEDDKSTVGIRSALFGEKAKEFFLRSS